MVRVQASSVNGFDLAVSAGYLAGMMEHRYPVVLGKDFAGTVEAIGEGVTRFAVGQSVFGVVTKAHLGEGGLGELTTVAEAIGITTWPEGLEPATAGALGLAGTAALDSLSAAAVQNGETVLISGATGGVGAIAIQYAVASGARVIATARPGQEEAFVRDLGAQEAVDHTGDVSAQVRALAPEGVDVVLHFAGDGVALAGLLSDQGRIVSLLAPVEHPNAHQVMATPTAETLDRLAADVVAGRLRLPVGAAFSLEEAPAAFAAFAGGTLGKIAVSLG
nr:NADP-dependent oxidoreductase [Kineosporia babensis]